MSVKTENGSSQEGSIFAAIDFGETWPPKSHTIYRQKIETLTLEIRLNELAQIEVCLGDPTFKSQPFEFSNVNRALMMVSWDANKSPSIKVNLNKQSLDSSETNSTKLIPSKPRNSSSVPSIYHPEAAKACSEWVKWRKERYGALKKQTKKDRVVKTISEQIQGLHNSIDILKSNINLFNGKEDLFISSTRLRSGHYCFGLMVGLQTTILCYYAWPDTMKLVFRYMHFKIR